MNKTEEMKEILEEYPKYQEALFIRGYLITDKEIESLYSYPFYGNWNKEKLGVFHGESKINVYYHKKQNCYVYKENGITAAIIGHAYNPFDMKYDEIELLKDCIKAYQNSKKTFFNKLNELTGIHLIFLNDGKRLIAVQDCSGMKSCYFGKVYSNIYITSHSQLVGDICNLKIDPFVYKLVNSYSYNIGNRYLPGNITPFKELKRLGGNTYVEYIYKFNIKRFYPTEPYNEINKEEFDKRIKKIADIIHKNIELAKIKWEKPAISLSGGIDSKTTLACANGLYKKLIFFSFHCKPQELVDANAAHKICNKIGIDHSIYSIPKNNYEVKDFYLFKKIIDHNTSYFKNTSDHEIRKMIYLYNLHDFDIELKSWASEITRCFLERKYGIKMPKVLTGRHFSIFQTRYFLVSDLLLESDKIYNNYMKEVGLENPIHNYEHSDLFYWEVRMGAWGTSVVSSLDFCHDVTMPFNNRKLIELFLSFPKQYRKHDEVHKAVIKLSNKKIADIDSDIKNLYFHSYRIWLEKLYYYYRTILYREK
jgi:hypothetical protein